MTDKEKLEKIKELADKMYSRMAYLTSETRPIRQAMEEYHQFIINEYHKEEQTIPDIVDEHYWEMLGEEPVSELEDAATKYSEKKCFLENAVYTDGEMLIAKVKERFNFYDIATSFEDGANWQKENLWKPADGDDLPEYDREVIAILDYDFGHYKVVYAHRPNPNGWNGTNIDTEEKEHFEPVTYGKGGWNQPHVLYWLDTKLPYKENKITK